MAPNSCSIFAPETFTGVSPETREKMEIYRTMRNRYGDRRSQAIKAEHHRIREIMLLGGEEEVLYLYDRLWNYVPPQKKNRKRKLAEVHVDDKLEKEGATDNPHAEDTASNPPTEDTASNPSADDTASNSPTEDTASNPPADDTTRDPPAEGTTSNPPAAGTTSNPPAEGTTRNPPARATRSNPSAKATTSDAPKTNGKESDWPTLITTAIRESQYGRLQVGQIIDKVSEYAPGKYSGRQKSPTGCVRPIIMRMQNAKIPHLRGFDDDERLCRSDGAKPISRRCKWYCLYNDVPADLKELYGV